MKRYEGLFILEMAGKEEGIKDVLDKVQAEITAAGGKIETLQKMEKKAFTRVADKKHTAGYYANIIFEATPGTITTLRSRFAMNEDVFRAIFTVAPEVKKAETK
ncbi:MAG: 30S ribosomal protein S6 [Verrucomicrobia bacterium]|nr:30S ribosomal protein S6 [Verrucomicrobiota bacterium]